MQPTPERIVAVFDCMIFLQGAARRESPAGVCLALAEQKIIDLRVSRDILAEVGDVLRRPAVQSKFPALTDGVVAEFITALESIATVIDTVNRGFALERDPKDEPYLNLACAIGADYLVTRHADLLDLAIATEGVGQLVREKHPRLTIVDPICFLRAVRASQPQSR